MTAMEGADWTLAFRRLADEPLCAPSSTNFARMSAWLPAGAPVPERGLPRGLPSPNPAVIPRNHKVEEALAAATDGDMHLSTRFLPPSGSPSSRRSPSCFRPRPALALTSPTAAPDPAMSRTAEGPMSRRAPIDAPALPRHHGHGRPFRHPRPTCHLAAQRTQGPGLSLDAAAKLSGVSRSMVSQIERGESSPTVATLVALTQALQLDFAGLLEGRPAPGIEVTRATATPVIQRGGVTIRILSAPESVGSHEVYELAFAKDTRLTSEPPFPRLPRASDSSGGRLTVTSGEASDQLAPATLPATRRTGRTRSPPAAARHARS